jgi:hypothetical protein
MPIEIKELHIKVGVDDETATAANGSDEVYRTQFGNSNAYNLDPAGAADLLLEVTDDDGDGAGLAADGGQPEEGICHGVTVLAWARVDGTSPSGDDVVVDGRIITGEGFEPGFGDGSVRFVTGNFDLF